MKLSNAAALYLLYSLMPQHPKIIRVRNITARSSSIASAQGAIWNEVVDCLLTRSLPTQGELRYNSIGGPLPIISIRLFEIFAVTAVLQEQLHRDTVLIMVILIALMVDQWLRRCYVAKE